MPQSLCLHNIGCRIWELKIENKLNSFYHKCIMGQSKSKALKYPQYPQPPGYPTYGPVYPYGIPPQVGYAPGYHGPVIPPGYGVPVAMPQPQVSIQMPPRSRRKKKRRRASGSSAGHGPMQPPDQTRNAAVGVQPAPPGMLDNLPAGFIPTNITPNPPGGAGAFYSLPV